MLRARTARDERGFTLVEVLAASVVMLVGLTATLALINQANQATADNRDREAANNLARQVTETAKRVAYAGVTPNGILTTLQAQPGMADADITKPGWQLKAKGSDKRETQTFTVAPSVCSVDDAKDGIGSHATGTWCSTASATSPADSTPEDYRKLTLTIMPPEGSGAGTTKMSSFIANNRDGISSPGGSSGSGVGEGYAILMDPLCNGCNQNAWSNLGQVAPCRTFTATLGTDKCLPTHNGAPGANYAEGNQITSIPIKAVFPTAAASVKFYLVDFPRYLFGPGVASYPPEELLGDATVDPGTDNRSWRYTWDLADTYPNQTPDGYYNIKAIAYDANGQRIGNKLILSFWLNRFIPDLGYWTAPVAGRNTQHCTTASPCPNTSNGKVEVEWYPRTPVAGRRDYDLHTFKVYRNTATPVLACTVFDILGGHAPGFDYNPVLGHRTAGSQCQDNATPATPTSGSVTYTVRATSFGPDGWVPVEGGNVQAASPNVNVSPVNVAPVAPTSLTAAWVGGNIRFSINMPSTGGTGGRGDSTPGDCITSFRIYWSNTTTTVLPRSNRVMRTESAMAACSPPGVPSTASTYVYDRPAANLGSVTPGTTTKWWVTAVDKTLNESGAKTYNLFNP